MGFELAQVIAELGQGVFLGAELISGKDGSLDWAGAPSAELSTPVEEDIHETQHTGALDLAAGDFGVSGGDEQSQRLEQGEVDVDIESLGLELSETVADASQSLTNSFQGVQGFVDPKSLRLLLRTPQRRKVVNFSYMRSNATPRDSPDQTMPDPVLLPVTNFSLRRDNLQDRAEIYFRTIKKERPRSHNA